MTGAEARKLVEAGTPCQWLDDSGNWNDCIITPEGGCRFLEWYKYRVNPNGGNLPVGTMGVYRNGGDPDDGKECEIIKNDQSDIPYKVWIVGTERYAWVTRKMFEPVLNRGGFVRCIKLPETISVMTPKVAIAESVIQRAIDAVAEHQKLILIAKKIETRADIRKRLLHL